MTTLFSRRAVLATSLGLIAPPLRAAQPAIHVLKDPGCGCCGA